MRRTLSGRRIRAQSYSLLCDPPDDAQPILCGAHLRIGVRRKRRPLRPKRVKESTRCIYGEVVPSRLPRPWSSKLSCTTAGSPTSPAEGRPFTVRETLRGVLPPAASQEGASPADIMALGMTSPPTESGYRKLAQSSALVPAAAVGDSDRFRLQSWGNSFGEICIRRS
jgi:hypothetical protein